MDLRSYLRRATRDLHDSLDGFFAGTDLGDEANYAEFLCFQYAARAPIERWLAENFDEAGLPPAQSSLIEADLADLGTDLPECSHFHAPPRPMLLGAAWALAGSHLGNLAMLQEMPENHRLPVRFMADADMHDYWKRLRPTLLQTSHSPIALHAAQTAHAVFRCFLDAVQCFDRKLAA